MRLTVIFKEEEWKERQNPFQYVACRQTGQESLIWAGHVFVRIPVLWTTPCLVLVPSLLYEPLCSSAAWASPVFLQSQTNIIQASCFFRMWTLGLEVVRLGEAPSETGREQVRLDQTVVEQVEPMFTSCFLALLSAGDAGDDPQPHTYCSDVLLHLL